MMAKTINAPSALMDRLAIFPTIGIADVFGAEPMQCTILNSLHSRIRCARQLAGCACETDWRQRFQQVRVALKQFGDFYVVDGAKPALGGPTAPARRRH